MSEQSQRQSVSPERLISQLSMIRLQKRRKGNGKTLLGGKLPLGGEEVNRAVLLWANSLWQLGHASA